MKKMIMIVAVDLSFSATALADDRPVDYNKLPAPAKEFVKQYFPEDTVLGVSKDDDFVRPDYTVLLSGGAKIEFEHSGALEKISVRGASVPVAILPMQIADYVKKNYSGASVKEYEIGRAVYEVKLSNGLELTFSSTFRLVDIDD